MCHDVISLWEISYFPVFYNNSARFIYGFDINANGETSYALQSIKLKIYEAIPWEPSYF